MSHAQILAVPVFLIALFALAEADIQAQGNSFTRGPFVQNATTNSIQIIWRTTNAASTCVEYGLTPALGTVLSNRMMVTEHVATLTGLAPDTTYYYRASSQDTAGSLPSTLETFRTLKVEGPVNFVVVGDTGFGSVQQGQIADVLRNATPELVVHLGDTVLGPSDAEFNAYFFNYYSLQIRQTPFYICVGNHDVGSGNSTTAFENTFHPLNRGITGSQVYYSFDDGDAHFVLLFNPSWSLFSGPAITAGDPQYNWLTNDLAASAKPWKLLFMHLPLADSGAYAGTTNGMMDVLLPVAELYGVQMIFGSHDHNYERFAPTNGVHHCVSGGGGRNLYAMTKQNVASAQFWPVHHCLTVGITNDTMTVQALDTNGVVFDGFTVQKGLPPRRVYPATWHTPRVESSLEADDGDGNSAGQNFDFIGLPIYPRSGRFSNLGQVYVNNDATNLYIGFAQVMMYRGNNVFLFIESPRQSGVGSMAGVGNGFVDPEGQGADGLDCLENLSFTNFAPSIGCLLGDEYADGQYRSFVRSNLALNLGQGVFRLDADLSTVPGARLQQFNRSPQSTLPADGIASEQNADFIELAIPLSELGGLAPGDTIKLGAVIGGAGVDTNAQTRDLDTSVLGCALEGSGQGPVVLEGVSVQLAADPALGPPRVAITALASNQYQLTWSAAVGQKYDLEYAASLPNFVRLNLRGWPRTALSTNESCVVAPLRARGFYRVKQVP